jgi:hypothetical protein
MERLTAGDRRPSNATRVRRELQSWGTDWPDVDWIVGADALVARGMMARETLRHIVASSPVSAATNRSEEDRDRRTGASRGNGWGCSRGRWRPLCLPGKAAHRPRPCSTSSPPSACCHPSPSRSRRYRRPPDHPSAPGPGCRRNSELVHTQPGEIHPTARSLPVAKATSRPHNPKRNDHAQASLVGFRRLPDLHQLHSVTRQGIELLALVKLHSWVHKQD